MIVREHEKGLDYPHKQLNLNLDFRQTSSFLCLLCSLKGKNMHFWQIVDSFLSFELFYPTLKTYIIC